MSFGEFAAYERVWKLSKKQERFQWAASMALHYNINRGDAPAKTAYDFLDIDERPAGVGAVPWRTQDVETQKLSIRQMLSYAAEVNKGKVFA